MEMDHFLRAYCRTQLLGLALAAVPFIGLAQIQDRTEMEALLDDELNTIEVVERYGPSVVAVHVTVQGTPVSPLADVPEEQVPEQLRSLIPFLEPRAPVQQSAGSGFLVEVDGKSRLVTNFHVIRSAMDNATTDLVPGGKIEVTFPERPGHRFEVRVLGVNPSFDLALLELIDGNYPASALPLDIADSDALKVGQKVIAIGNPFGLASTVTSGIVSAVGRLVPSIGQILIPMVQTDAAINPGNSGGPLLNSRGELIGVNTSILNPAGRSFAGLGFAVPSNLLAEALANLDLGGISSISDTRPSLGVIIRSVRLLPESIRGLLGLPNHGVAVLTVIPDSPADKAGLRGSNRAVLIGSLEFQAGGDVIIAVDGERIESAQQLSEIVIYQSMAGDALEFEIVRDGTEMSLRVVLEFAARK